MKKLIKQKFKRFKVEFGDGWINIARKKDGVHCEFYGTIDKEHAFLCATYTINGKEQDLDYFIDVNNLDDLDLFYDDVKEILK